MNLAHWLGRMAAVAGDRPALMLGDRVVADFVGLHRQAAALARALAEGGVRPGDRVALFMKNCPEFLVAFWGAWIAGAAVVPVRNRLHPREAADILDHSGAARVFVTADPGAARDGVSPVPATDVADRSHARWRERLGSVGRAQAAVEVAIGDGRGGIMPSGTPGEIMVRGRTVMPGYWRDAEATAKTLVDGWLLTGDIAQLDAEGYPTLTDRSKDVINSGGSNIYPREVEEVLLDHSSVREASVVGRRDARWGEVVVDFDVPAAGAEVDPAALDRFCRENIARFKRPKLYRVLGQLPKNNYGKVLKTELRRMLEEEP